MERQPDVIARGLLGAAIACALLSLGSGGCRLPIGDPVHLPTPSPTTTPAPTPTPEPTPDLDIPHGPDWKGPRAALPTLTDAVNTVLSATFGCDVNSRCVVAPGSDKVGADQGWANYDAAQTRFIEGMRAKGYRAGFHEPHHTDEACVYPTPSALECEAFKVATDGGDIVLAWAGTPREPCFGGKDEHGFPVGLGCRGVGGGSFRGLWRYGAGE